MGYYDIYDSYDRCIASDVWIDDGSNSGTIRPTIINYYKLIMIVCLICGIANTFVSPILLFINKDVFIEFGWLIMACTNWLIGIPTFIVSINMLKAMSDTNSNKDQTYEKARLWCEKNINNFANNKPVKNEEEISDEEYKSNTRKSNKNSATIALVYLVYKFEKLLKVLTYVSYLIYPLLVLCLLLEIIIGEQDTYFIALFNINFISMFCYLFSISKNYKNYKFNYKHNIIKRIVKISIISLLIGVITGIMLFNLLNINGHLLLVYLVAVADIVMLLDSKLLCKHLAIKDNKNSVNIGKIILFSILIGLALLLIAAVISLLPGPIYDALLAYDNGLSTDLTLPIIFYLSMIVIYIGLVLLISLVVVKNSDKKKSYENSKS